MGIERLLFPVLLSMLTPGSVQADSASASVSVNIIHPSAVQVVQGLTYGVAAQCGSSWTFTLSNPLKPGSAIVGAFKWETNSNCSGGGADRVTLGSQQGTILGTISPTDFGLGYCCPGVSYFVLLNAAGGQSDFTIFSSNGGNFTSPIGELTEVSGLGSNASVDATSRIYYNPAPGTGNDVLTSGSITPTAAGDFLYGHMVTTYTNGGSMRAGTGWTAGPNNGDPTGSGLHSMVDEYILNYNAIAPKAATFSTTDAGGEWPVGIIAIKP
jgi:hypothetical protein